MDNDTKRFLGSVLGEVYRIQRRIDPPMCEKDDSTIYGLLHGFEHVIDEQLELVGWVSEADVEAVSDILGPIWEDEAKLASFKGYYDIERPLKAAGIERAKALKILRYFLAAGQFEELIHKMDTSNSPIEARKVRLRNSDL